MKNILILLVFILAAISFTACGDADRTPDVPVSETPADVPLPETERPVMPHTDTTEHVSAEVPDTTAEVEREQDRPTGRMRPEVMAYRPVFRAIIGDDNRPTVMGKTTAGVDSLLGAPMALVRQTAANPEFSREVRIYSPYDEDPTGFYIYFRGGVVVEERLDEFNGLYGSAVLEWFKM